MRRSALHRLTTKVAALLAIAAMGFVQPMLSACTCGVTAPEGVAAQSVETPACCSSCSSTHAEDPAVAACCSSGDGGAHDCRDCSCCVSSEEFPLSSPASSVQADDASPAVSYFATAANAFHCGLNGAAWHNAFDLASPGGPPGVRLHALLSVWRN